MRTIDHLSHFDERAKLAREGTIVLRGDLFYRGYQGDLPVLSNDRPLWLTTDIEQAHAYARWGNSRNAGGVLILAARAEMTALSMAPDGIGFLISAGRSEHGYFAACLHDWAMRRRVDLIDEGDRAFISMCPLRDFSVARR